MSILFLSSVFPSPISPTKGSFNRDLVAAIADETPVQVIVPIPWVDELKSRVSRGARLPATRQEQLGDIAVSYPRFWYPPGVMHDKFDRFLEWSLSRQMRAVAINPPQAVLSYWAHPDGAVAMRLARRLKVPGWIMVGGSDVLLLSKNPRRGRVIREALQNADGIITVSDDIRQRLLSMGLAEDAIHLVRRGVDQTVFHPGNRSAARCALALPERGPMFLWVGRMVDVKNLELLTDAFAKVNGRNTDWQLFLIGDGPKRGMLIERVRRAGLSEQVHFVGPIAHHNLAAWYQAADRVVLTSRSEGVPNVLLEARACGTPFIATNVGGISEISLPGIDHLVPTEDAAAFAAAVFDTLGKPRGEGIVPAMATDDCRTTARVILGLLTAKSKIAREERMALGTSGTLVH